MSSIKEQMDELRARHIQWREDIAAAVPDLIEKMQELLASQDNDNLYVEFKTYTPSFNDGEPLYRCTYGNICDAASQNVWDEQELSRSEIERLGLEELDRVVQFFANFVVEEIDHYGNNQIIKIHRKTVEIDYLEEC